MSIGASGWLKVFADETFCSGFDNNPATSWSRTRLTDIIGVYLQAQTQFQMVKIFGTGEFWQSDDYVCNFQLGPSASRIVARRIMKKIHENDKAFYFSDPGGTVLGVTFVSNLTDLKTGKVVLLEPSDIGKWLVLEIDETTHISSYYFSEVRK